MQKKAGSLLDLRRCKGENSKSMILIKGIRLSLFTSNIRKSALNVDF